MSKETLTEIVGTDLGNKMRALADEGHERAEELREKADKFDWATEGWCAVPQSVTTGAFLRHWANARRLWCECTGETLV